MTSFSSSTRDIPSPDSMPRHIALIMDGNGRWAKKRYLPRVAGHKQDLVCVQLGELAPPGGGSLDPAAAVHGGA